MGLHRVTMRFVHILVAAVIFEYALCNEFTENLVDHKEGTHLGDDAPLKNEAQPEKLPVQVNHKSGKKRPAVLEADVIHDLLSRIAERAMKRTRKRHERAIKRH